MLYLNAMKKSLNLKGYSLNTISQPKKNRDKTLLDLIVFA